MRSIKLSPVGVPAGEWEQCDEPADFDANLRSGVVDERFAYELSADELFNLPNGATIIDAAACVGIKNVVSAHTLYGDTVLVTDRGVEWTVEWLERGQKSVGGSVAEREIDLAHLSVLDGSLGVRIIFHLLTPPHTASLTKPASARGHGN